MSYRYFTDDEAKGLAPELLSKLDTARSVAAIPFRITSGLRTCAANASVLGAEHSAHIKGLAVDLGLGHLAAGYERDHARCLMKKALFAAGFRRVGSYDLHIHIDVGQEPDYAQDVEWQKAGQ